MTNYGLGTGKMNQYSSVGAQAPAYDANCNLRSYAGWSYSYDADNRLTAVSGYGASHQLTSYATNAYSSLVIPSWPE